MIFIVYVILEVLICETKPCGIGICSVTSNGGFTCNCEGTYYTGDRCEKAYAIISPIGTQTVNIPFIISITTHNPRAMISIKTSDTSKLTMNSNQKLPLSIAGINSSIEQVVNFTLVARFSGSYTISYTIEPLDIFIQPEDSTVLVIPMGASGSSRKNFFEMLNLENGILVQGCYKNHVNVAEALCPSSNTLVFESFCKWENYHSASIGVIFVTVNDIKLPLSIAGINLKCQSIMSMHVNKIEMTPLLNTEGISTTCSQAYCNTKSSLPTDSVLFDEQEIHTFLKYDSLLKTFFERMQPRLPSWLSIDVPTSSTESNIAGYDFSSSLSTAEEIQALDGCESYRLDSSSKTKVYFVLRAFTDIKISFDNSQNSILSSYSKPQCFVLDICSTTGIQLHYLIPPSLQPFELSSSLSFFTDMLANNGTLSFGTMMFFMDKETQHDNIDLMYWNGVTYFKPALSQSEFKIEVELNKIFVGNNLKVRIIYSGSVFYHSNPIGEKVIPAI